MTPKLKVQSPCGPFIHLRAELDDLVGPLQLNIFCKKCYRRINFIIVWYCLICLIKVTEKLLVICLKYIVSFMYWIPGCLLKITSESSHVHFLNTLGLPQGSNSVLL